MSRFIATYLIESPLPLEAAAQILAGEQSSGTFVAVPGETAMLRERHGARLEEIEALDLVDNPSLPGAMAPAGGGSYNRGRVRISFPAENVGTNLSALISTVAGNLFELRQLSAARLEDLELPMSFMQAQPGPQFGITGTRRLTGVTGRPILGTIIKPSVGLTPEQTAALVAELADAGIDFVKDDELMADPPHSPFKQRVDAVMKVVKAAADRTGKKVMVAFNVSGEIDDMKRHHDVVLEAGGTCVMASVNTVGLAGVMALRRHSVIPIHGHRNGWGMLNRYPGLGLSFAAYQTLWRLAGVDQLHCNGIQNKFWEPDDSVEASIKACLKPLAGDDRILPVISSGQWGGQAPETWRRIQSVDLMYLAGGGIMAHPDGPRGGVHAIRQAWEAAVDGIELTKYAETHPELKRAIERFSSAKRSGAG